MFNIKITSNFKLIPLASVKRAAIAHETAKLVADVGIKSHSYLKTNTMFNSSRSRGKLLKHVSLQLYQSNFYSSAQIYIKKVKETAHIYATEYGFSSTRFLTSKSTKLMKIPTANFSYKNIDSQYIFRRTIRRGLYSGKFMFRTTFYETKDYLEKKYMTNTIFLERIAKLIIAG